MYRCCFRKNNTNKNINRQTKQHQWKHQQRDKTTSMQTLTDRQNNINTNINRLTKHSHFYESSCFLIFLYCISFRFGVFICVGSSVCWCSYLCWFVDLLMFLLVLFCLSVDVFIGVV
jgi:hypothetical protein